MKAHNNGLHLHASSFSGSAMGIVENAARATFEGGAQVKPEPLCAKRSGVLLYVEVSRLGALKKRVWPNEKWSSSLAERNDGWSSTVRLPRGEARRRRASRSEAGGHGYAILNLRPRYERSHE